MQLGSIRTLFDTIKLYMDYDISVFYIVSTEFEIIDVLFIKDISKHSVLSNFISFPTALYTSVCPTFTWRYIDLSLNNKLFIVNFM